MGELIVVVENPNCQQSHRSSDVCVTPLPPHLITYSYLWILIASRNMFIDISPIIFIRLVFQFKALQEVHNGFNHLNKQFWTLFISNHISSIIFRIKWLKISRFKAYKTTHPICCLHFWQFILRIENAVLNPILKCSHE